MGTKLVAYYEYIEDKMGRDGKVRLAQITRVPSVLAQAEDDAKYLKVFRDAIKQLTGAPPPD